MENKKKIIRLILKEKKGQSLVEVSVALTIVIVVSVSMLSVVTASKNLLYDSEDRTKANVLAQEGIEIVRKHRNDGCQFGDLEGKENKPDNTNDYYVIEGDTNGDSDIIRLVQIKNGGSVNVSPSLSNVIPNNIEGFNDQFTRKLYIYKLSDLTTIAGYGWISSNFPNTNHDFDKGDKYYYIKAVISWADRYGQQENFEVSTIMIKRWKDI